MQVAPHLGGFVPGGDEATYYPELWTWLVRELNVRSVLDVGCGDGVALGAFRKLGCNALGIEGVPQDNPWIIEHDYTREAWPLDVHVAPADLVWCCEFVEHVEERHVPNFLETFKCASLVLLTHAFPGQAGHHHVNCRTPDYWKGVMAGAGYLCDEALTDRTRMLAGLNPSPWNHYKRSGLAFRRVT